MGGVMRKLVRVLSSHSCRSSSLGGASAFAQGFLAGEVTDTGGIDDRSFNASAWKGLQDAQGAGMQIQYLQSTNQSDYVPNIQQFVQKKAGIIVTVGFLMGDDTGRGREGQPGPEVRHRRLRLRSAASQRPRADLQDRRSRLPRRAILRRRCQDRARWGPSAG